MIKACELKKSSVIDIDGTPHIIQNITQQSPTARGGGTIYKVRFRNVSTNQKVDQTYRSEDPLQEATYDKSEVQYLYKDGDRYAFMDLESYEQFELMAEDIEDCLPFLIEDMEGITALVSEGRVLTLQMPDTIELEIVECPPAMKGASATSRTKPATLTTGLIVQVPEYIAPGEVVKVDTRERKFLSRA
ncbi:elongation factor P-like protein EfpL [Pontiella sulfatireligans]|uniref:Elongation factor P-like protein n=1 Tax=Pontiella sulfatireligans TaxID=2750658 RepID=A0A6C2UFI7_9BACT|nr:elongation factor P-like protein YeiP [Pontiella sulfatireligans]VGO17966.1 Elongation factor P-like protein [Pontiella sulfatireligans]